MTTRDDLVKRATELGIEGISSRWKDETLQQKITEAESSADLAYTQSIAVDLDALPEAAESLPVSVTTEPMHVEANGARFDENHSEAGAVMGDPEVLNPGEEAAVGGPQDRNFMQAVRDADASSDFASVQVTNAEAGVFNDVADLSSPTTGSTVAAKPPKTGTGAGGPAGKVN